MIPLTPNDLFDYIMAVGTAVIILGVMVCFVLGSMGFFDK
jgi:hypothetical protein